MTEYLRLIGTFRFHNSLTPCSSSFNLSGPHYLKGQKQGKDQR